MLLRYFLNGPSVLTSITSSRRKVVFFATDNEFEGGSIETANAALMKRKCGMVMLRLNEHPHLYLHFFRYRSLMFYLILLTHVTLNYISVTYSHEQRTQRLNFCLKLRRECLYIFTHSVRILIVAQTFNLGTYYNINQLLLKVKTHLIQYQILYSTCTSQDHGDLLIWYWPANHKVQIVTERLIDYRVSSEFPRCYKPLY